ERLRPGFMAIVRSVRRMPEDQAEDIVQDAITDVFGRAPWQTMNEPTLASYLNTAVRNATLDYGRALTRAVQAGEVREIDVEPATEAEDDDRSRTLAEHIAKLPPEHQAIIRAVYIEGHSVASAAKALGVSRPTAHKRHQAALAAMRSPDSPARHARSLHFSPDQASEK